MSFGPRRPPSLHPAFRPGEGKFELKSNPSLITCQGQLWPFEKQQPLEGGSLRERDACLERVLLPDQLNC